MGSEPVLPRDFPQLVRIDPAAERFVESLQEHLLLWTRARVLVVVDTEITTFESPGGFGVGRVVRLLRESGIGCLRFRVDIARRSNSAFAVDTSPAPHQPKYEGFRFDSTAPGSSNPIINDYQVLLLFGFKPGNDNGPDSNITLSPRLPASNAELRVLTKWMNDRRGGVFATGDHDYLGASMCHRIPRIRGMRLWTNAQGVPPQNPPERIDSNRPQAGSSHIPINNERDAIPQPIEWVPWRSVPVGPFSVRRRPHPLLCHPQLGPIDVMPDHPHEGKCFETDPAFQGPHLDASATYDFSNGVAGDDYPSVDGSQELPRVIARGRTLPAPPYTFGKGDSPAKHFAMISAYDGHVANVGRAVVDSTWHHWMDMNITGLEAGNAEAWEKIARYFLNVAQWLLPPGFSTRCLWLHLVRSRFEYIGLIEYGPHFTLLEAGRSIRQYLARYYGPCWITQWTLDWMRPLIPELVRIPRVPQPDPCLTCPPFEIFEDIILGAVVRAVDEQIAPLRKEVLDRGELKVEIDIKDVDAVIARGVEAGLAESRKILSGLDLPSAGKKPRRSPDAKPTDEPKAGAKKSPGKKSPGKKR